MVYRGQLCELYFQIWNRSSVIVPSPIKNSYQIYATAIIVRYIILV